MTTLTEAVEAHMAAVEAQERGDDPLRVLVNEYCKTQRETAKAIAEAREGVRP